MVLPVFLLSYLLIAMLAMLGWRGNAAR